MSTNTKQQKIDRANYLDNLRENDPRKYVQEIRDTCEKVSYPGGSFALYDAITDTYYNSCGQKLKNPEDYHADNDGRYY